LSTMASNFKDADNYRLPYFICSLFVTHWVPQVCLVTLHIYFLPLLEREGVLHLVKLIKCISETYLSVPS
jgi:hypothetical protein